MIDLEQFEGHVEGPWHLDVHTNVMKGDGLVAFPGSVAGFNQKANGRLIAAAPELLAECKRLRAREAELMEALKDCLNPVFGDFEAALAKTESEG
jgi:hypothetical protein